MLCEVLRQRRRLPVGQITEGRALKLANKAMIPHNDKVYRDRDKYKRQSVLVES